MIEVLQGEFKSLSGSAQKIQNAYSDRDKKYGILKEQYVQAKGLLKEQREHLQVLTRGDKQKRDEVERLESQNQQLKQAIADLMGKVETQ